MKKFNIIPGNRQFYVYSFPIVANDAGNFELTLLTDTDFYATSVSSNPTDTFFLYNLSTEKQTIPTKIPFQIPVNTGQGGTPFFFPLPWRLKAGTLLRLVPNPLITISQVSVAGYRA